MKIVDLEPFLAEFGLNSVRIGISVKNYPHLWCCSPKTRLQCRFSAENVSVAGWLAGQLNRQLIYIVASGSYWHTDSRIIMRDRCQNYEQIMSRKKTNRGKIMSRL